VYINDQSNRSKSYGFGLKHGIPFSWVTYP